MSLSAPAQAAASPVSGMLVNIDNGGTLTDICVLRGTQVYRAKTITTPDDLSRCLFEGLRKASREVYGSEDLQRLLLETECIRYSTTQGTNALVERKGPRLGLILLGGLDAETVSAADENGLYEALVGSRCVRLTAEETRDEKTAVAAVNKLTAAGANRLAVVSGGDNALGQEKQLQSLLLRKFPPQMLGAVPVVYGHEITQDANAVRVAWTALFNSFLHPAIEHFLYNAEHRLRDMHAQRPLLVFRNDGQAARIARTIAIKTYSSGPRGGAEGTIALARHYQLNHVVSVDVGGTTTDTGVVENGQAAHQQRGSVEGIATSFPLCDLPSLGVGGGSIIRAVDGAIQVGPESTGSAPGPACFGLGGQDATITDALLLSGLLDPASYFGGEMSLDRERARSAIARNVAEPMGISVEEAAERMQEAWVSKIAEGIRAHVEIRPDTALAAFGGGGPMLVCKIAEAAGINTVIIPGLAAVFSAYGIGFSDIGHQYEAPLSSLDQLELTKARLSEQARRGIFAEGFEIEDCEMSWHLGIASTEGDRELALQDGQSPEVPAAASLSLRLQVNKVIAHAEMTAQFTDAVAAATHSQRDLVLNGSSVSLPLYRVEEQAAGASASGPAVLEEAYFTARIDAGWNFQINAAGDIRLTRA